MKSFLLILGSALFLMACGPNARFSEVAEFNSLMDGETVEVVANDQLDEIISNEGDGGLRGNNTQGDAGAMGGPSGQNPREGSISRENRGDDDDDGGQVEGRDPRRGMANRRGGNCRSRVVRQYRERRMRDIATSPREMDEDREINDVIGCGNERNKKVRVCHYPSGNFSKRKTLCVGRASLEAHLRFRARSVGKASRNKFYAGPCQESEESDQE